MLVSEECCMDALVDPSGTIRHFRGPSLRSSLLALLLRTFVRPSLKVFARWPDFAWPYRAFDLAGLFLPPLRGTTREALTLTHARAELLVPAAVDSDRAILYAHGGGFVVCGLRTHRRLVSRIARQSHCPALAIDYRMVPRVPVAEAINDCVDGFEALLKMGFQAHNITVMGDSAGAFLALMTAKAVTERGLGTPAAVVCMAPFLFLDPAARANRVELQDDPLFPPEAVAALTVLVHATGARNGIHRTISPLDDEVSLSGLPPVLIQSGSRELLAWDSLHLAEQLQAAGVAHELQIWNGQFHVFQAAADLVPEARRAIKEVGAFVRASGQRAGLDLPRSA
jgi:acetyl esterase/lipase